MINAPSDAIWLLITEIEKWPKRFKHVTQAQMNGAFAAGESFAWKSDGIKIVSTIQKIEQKTFILWTGKAFGTQAVHSWTLTQQGNDTLLETSESLDGWLVRLMPRLMKKTLDQTLVGWLETIKQLAESNK